MNSILFQPFHLHDLTLPNRIVLSPMTRARAGAARLPNRLMAEYYAQRSSAGLLITEATTISEEANGWNESPGIYTDEMTEGWKHTTNAVHEKGGVIFLQLWHTGRASHSSFHGGKPAVAPSAIKINEPDIHTPTGKQPHEVPRALETSEIPRVVADYRRAAERAKQAGFDGVELHAANGYLIDQFLQSKTNHRTDEYGGSVENRYRFLKEVIEAVTSVWPAQRVGVRLSPNSPYNDMGSPDYREQFSFVAGQLDRFGLAYLHVLVLKQAKIPRLAGLGRRGQRSRTVSVPLREGRRGLDPTFGVYRSPSFLLGGARRRGGSEHPDSDFMDASFSTAIRPPNGRRSAAADSSPTSDRSTFGRRGRSGTASAQTRSRMS